jgi:hypothetical protein
MDSNETWIRIHLSLTLASVADLEHFDSDSDPTIHFHASLNPAAWEITRLYLMGTSRMLVLACIFAPSEPLRSHL